MSSSDVAVSVQGLSKAYTIRNRRDRPTTAGEALLSRVKHPFRREQREEFWALRDVDLDICQGEVLGIIGRNGAGKSTLLKLLSRITSPTEGEIRLRGRVGSLLEVGTGFHPELTGRENVYLNGSILGMRRTEIDARFDEIVEFAGVEQFLDTPVKRYSSGMHVRLAFAVAANLDSEILLVDEVLAVGDAEFQQRCLSRIRDVSGAGRTVLLVSHQLHTIAGLAPRTIYLNAGQLDAVGPTDETINRYLGEQQKSVTDLGASSSRREGSGEARVIYAALDNPEPLQCGAEIRVNIGVAANVATTVPFHVSTVLRSATRGDVAQFDSRLVQERFEVSAESELQLAVSGLWLKPGDYALDIYLINGWILDAVVDAVFFTVVPPIPFPGTVGEDALRHGSVLAPFTYVRSDRNAINPSLRVGAV